MSSPGNTPESIDPNLVQRLRQFDADAWAEVVQLGTPWVYRWCRAADVPPPESGEIVQMVFNSVGRAIGNFRRELTVEAMREWWWSITRTKIKGYYHRQLEAAAAEQRTGELPETPPAEPSQGSTQDAFLEEAEFISARARILEIGRDAATSRRRPDGSLVRQKPPGERS